MLQLKVGEIVKKLYQEESQFREGIVAGGASSYHDQFGHVIASVFLTAWPRENPRISSPVVFSTETLVSEQIAELVQRMFIRCSPENIEKVKVLYPGTLHRGIIDNIQDAIRSQSPDGRCQVNFPCPNGQKLSKIEALSWACLFAIEDLHVFAKDRVSKKTKNFNTSLENRVQLLEKIFSTSKFNDFKVRVAQLMYDLAVNPSMLEETKNNRSDLIRNCLSSMGLEVYKSDLESVFADYLSDEELSSFYDTFIEYCDRLDERGIHIGGKPFSAMTIAELDALPIDYFLPSEEIPFKLVFENDISEEKYNDLANYWVGIARYEPSRDIYTIDRIIPKRC